MDTLFSPSGAVQLNVQNDGNLVLYHWDSASASWMPHWNSGTVLNPEPTLPIPPTPPIINLPLKTEANFCNLYDSTNRPIFSSCLAGMSAATKTDWIRREKAAGGNSYILSIEVGYPNYCSNLNFFNAGRMPEIFGCFDEIFSYQLTPVLFLSSGDSFPGIDYFKRLVDSLEQYEHFPSVKVVPAWEPVPGGWSTRNLYDVLTYLHTRIPRERLILHLGRQRLSWSSHPLEADDPFGGDEIASCRYSAPMISEFFYQSDPFRPGDSFDPAVNGNVERAIEIADRSLEGGKGPDWFSGLPRPILNAFELTAYYFIRGEGSPEYSREVAGLFKSLGYQGFGNGLPY